MANTISVDKLQIGINMISDSFRFGVLMDAMADTEVGDAKAQLASEFLTMLDLLMDDIREMDQTRALM